MDKEGMTDAEAFRQMASEFPVRTSIFTFGLPLFAFLQFLNGVVNDGSLLFIGGFSILVVAYSVLLTQYHVAVYRRRSITGGWANEN